MRIYLDNVGCRLNWSEIESLARELAAAGHSIVPSADEADTIVVNTCAVTAQAERKTRHQIRSLHRDNPAASLAVIGCYATLQPETAARLAGVRWVIPNAQKTRASDLLTHHSDAGEPHDGTGERLETLRTRAFVKVQDGCNNHCTYCIVRSLRGPARSRPLADVVERVQTLVQEAGSREVVLTGACLGSYGRDLGYLQGLRGLVEALLAETNLRRLRLSSLEPWDIDESFFELWADSRLCRQIHLPLQAGCDTTLRRMGRRITTTAFARLVTVARERIPDVAITTDVLVGFPGEDRNDFARSYAFIEEMAFAKIHVFPYSERPGTPASRLPNQVAAGVKNERARQVRSLARKERRRYRHRFVGRELPVLWEKQRQDGRWTGWTDNYLRVTTEAGQDLLNRITQARILTAESGHLRGEAIL
jgi:threonylcarbamoyladenosine tRNA methylthiotransferase MtaB